MACRARGARRGGPMKKALTILTAVLMIAAVAAIAADGQTAPKKLKVFISVDMEGVAGLIHWDETSEGGADYSAVPQAHDGGGQRGHRRRARRGGGRDRRPGRPRQRPEHPARPAPSRGPAHPRVEQPAEHDGGHRQDVRRGRLRRIPRPGGHAGRRPQTYDEPVALRRRPQRRAHARGRLERRDRRLTSTSRSSSSPATRPSAGRSRRSSGRSRPPPSRTPWAPPPR
ncbi:MAG: M55 family metallopeptidase [Marinilabiliales bacterium]|nr:M55 family metallopeptidase [Marinilabiliales bacterium]